MSFKPENIATNLRVCLREWFAARTGRHVDDVEEMEGQAELIRQVKAKTGVHIDQGSMSRYLRRVDPKPPRLGKMAALAKTLGVSNDRLMWDGTGDKPR